MEPLAPNFANSTGTYCVESSVVPVPKDGVLLPLFQNLIAPSFEDQSFSSLYPYLDEDTGSLFHKQWLDTSSAFQTDASLGQTQEMNSGASLVSGNPLKVPDIDAIGSTNKGNFPCRGPVASKLSQMENTENFTKKTKRGRKHATDVKKKLPAARELHMRENNRKAADRHRSRKRREAEELVARQKALEAQNNHLYASYNSLRVEALDIKWQLLQHTDCDCVMIQQYIENEAKHCLDSLLSLHSSSPYISGLMSDQQQQGSDDGERSVATNLAMSPDINHADNGTLKSISSTEDKRFLRTHRLRAMLVDQQKMMVEGEGRS